MPAEQVKLSAATLRLLRNASLALCIVLTSAVCACRMHLDDSTLALEAATAPVLDSAAEAYRAANTLHNLREDYDAVAEFDAPDKVYNPRDIQVLLSDKDIAVRLAVLRGFRLYVKSLCAIVSGTNPKELGDASVSLGGQLTSLANTLVPSIQKAAGLNSGASGSPAISTETQNGITTGLDALGQFLISRKVKAELRSKIAAMDPHVQALATLLESDIDVLNDVSHRDYERIINLQTLALRKDTNLDSSEHREGIMKLPEIVRQQQDAEERLKSLRMAVVKLAQAHQQLVANAQGKTPESLKEKLGDLAASASDLGTFYSSLPTK